jgi:tetratricopeptide (TPR) repeat protein
MKRFFALVAVVLVVWSARGAGLDDQYVQIFNTIQEADRLTGSQPARALVKYLEAQTALRQLAKENPEWNPKVVSFRLNYLAGKIEALSTKPATPVMPAPAATNQAPVTPPLTPPAEPPAEPPVTSPAPTAPAAPLAEQPAPPPAAPPAPPATTVQPVGPSELAAQVNLLKEQVRLLQADKILLEAKLKEAFAVQPAAADPRELARAEEKIRSLQKENDLLSVSLDLQKAKPAQSPDLKGYEAAKQALGEANRVIAEQNALTTRLTLERDALQARLQNLGSDGQATAALRAENQLLKKQVADLQAAAPAATRGDETTRQLAQTRAQMALLQSDTDVLRLEKLALEQRIRRLAATNAPAAARVSAVSTPEASASASTAEASRVRKLERERDDLQKQLDAARKDLANRKGQSTDARVEALQNELATVRARLDSFEARSVPYSAEELALFKPPDPRLAPDPNAGKRPIKELPPGSAKLVAEAQSYFSARQYDKAEAAYTEVVRQDPKNVAALTDLAVTQIQAGHLESAEVTVKQALALAAENPYSLYALGLLRLSQARYDEAVDALSRAAKLDPQNPEVQNYLGLALSEKGLRGPAESALRKAIELQPNYAEAHYNLAVTYLNRQPPAPALARWHYDRAIKAGHARNPDLEKKLDAANL